MSEIILIIKSFFRILKNLTLSLILICLVMFMVNNREIVKISFFPLPIEIETKAFVIMIWFFLLGLSFGIIACSQSLIKKSISGFKNKNKIKKLEKQLVEKSGN